VEITDNYGFGFCVEEFAVTVMHEMPFTTIIFNDGHLRLICQAEELMYNMHYEVDTWYKDRTMTYDKFIDLCETSENININAFL